MPSTCVWSLFIKQYTGSLFYDYAHSLIHFSSPFTERSPTTACSLYVNHCQNVKRFRITIWNGCHTNEVIFKLSLSNFKILMYGTDDLLFPPSSFSQRTSFLHYPLHHVHTSVYHWKAQKSNGVTMSSTILHYFPCQKIEIFFLFTSCNCKLNTFTKLHWKTFYCFRLVLLKLIFWIHSILIHSQ